MPNSRNSEHPSAFALLCSVSRPVHNVSLIHKAKHCLSTSELNQVCIKNASSGLSFDTKNVLFDSDEVRQFLT